MQLFIASRGGLRSPLRTGSCRFLPARCVPPSLQSLQGPCTYPEGPVRVPFWNQGPRAMYDMACARTLTGPSGLMSGANSSKQRYKQTLGLKTGHRHRCMLGAFGAGGQAPGGLGVQEL